MEYSRKLKTALSTELQKRKRSADMQPPECDAFTKGDPGARTFTSPGYPEHYTKNISCVKVLTGEVKCKLALNTTFNTRATFS
jgi:hypothetical protein